MWLVQCLNVELVDAVYMVVVGLTAELATAELSVAVSCVVVCMGSVALLSTADQLVTMAEKVAQPLVGMAATEGQGGAVDCRS